MDGYRLDVTLPPRNSATQMAASIPEYASACVIPTTWTPFKIKAIVAYNHDTSVFQFALPEGQSLGLPVCGCLLVKAPDCEHGGGGGAWWAMPPPCNQTLSYPTLISIQ
jgi:hypothetical protein